MALTMQKNGPNKADNRIFISLYPYISISLYLYISISLYLKVFIPLSPDFITPTMLTKNFFGVYHVSEKIFTTPIMLTKNFFGVYHISEKIFTTPTMLTKNFFGVYHTSEKIFTTPIFGIYLINRKILTGHLGLYVCMSVCLYIYRVHFPLLQILCRTKYSKQCAIVKNKLFYLTTNR